MMGVDEEGYTRCVVMVELKKIEKFNPSEAEGKALESLMGAREEEAEDGYEEEPFQYTPITDFEVMYCKVREYTLDGSIVNLELIFDSPYDKEMEAVHKLLEEYKEMGEAFDKAEPGEGDYPIFTIYFMPYRYPMQATASYTQPFAYFKALSYDQDDERVLHLLFPIERTEIACYHVKKSELEAMKEHAASIQREGGYI